MDYLAWDRYHWPEALTWFARGMGAVMTGDVDEASEAKARMQELRDQAEAAVARTEEAAELERTVEKHAITPGALLPPDEALGDLLRDLDRPDDALVAYEASLQVWPERYRSILGAARAAGHF